MILRSVGHRRGDRRGPRGGRRADPAAGRAHRPRPAPRPLRGPPGRRRRPSQDGPWARLARRVMRHPVAVLVPTLGLPARPRARRSCTSASTPRTRACCRPASRRARPSTGCSDEFGEGEFAPIALAVRTDGAGHRPGQPGRACTTTRAGWPPTRGSRRVDSLVDVDPRLTLAQYQLLYGDPNGPRDRFVAIGPGGHDPRRPDRVHASRRRTARTATRAGRSSPTCATRTGRSPRRPA